MFKTLAAKAIIPVVFTTTGFIVVCCLLLYSSMQRDRIEENILHANDISNVLLKSTRYAMLQDDREALLNIVESVNEEHLVEYVRIFNKKGVIVFSGNSEDVGREVNVEVEGCSVCHSGREPIKTLGPMEQTRRFVSDSGEPVMATTAAIYNDETCHTAQCHHHPPTQTVLGTLDIGLSEGPLRHSLAVMGRRLTVFGVMMLLLIIGGVAALLQMNVVSPLRQLGKYLYCVSTGDTKTPPPRLAGELEEVASAVRKIQLMLKKGDTH